MFKQSGDGIDDEVLILIVVDNGLVPDKRCMDDLCNNSLNPYCSGQWSRTTS